MIHLLVVFLLGVDVHKKSERVQTKESAFFCSYPAASPHQPQTMI